MTRTVLKPQIHEAGAHLLFADPDDPDDAGLGRYFGFVSQFDQSFDLAEAGNTFDAAGETWQFNHNPDDDGPSINYWKGKIRADNQDYDAFYEYNIPLVAVDNTGEKKINFQFRPALPDAKHVDTGNRIKSMPADLPEGLRVQIQSANVDPDEYLSILKALFRNLGVHRGYLDDIHPYSRFTALALYVRIDRAISEERIVGRNGLLERLARFSAVRRGQGEWKWDNEEIVGHRTAVVLNPTALDKLYRDHQVAKLFKSYHMKNPPKEQGSVTYHPKFEIQWNKEYSPDEGAHWHETPDALDRHDVYGEIERMFHQCLYWADLPLRPDPNIYIEDAYFTLEASDRTLDLVGDPTESLVEHERDLATTTLVDADLTEKQKSTLRTIVGATHVQHVSDVAENAGVSESTVRRTIDKLGDVLRLSNGTVSPEDDVIAEKINDVFHAIDHVLDRARGSIQRLSSRSELVGEDSALGKWARRYAVTVDDSDPDAIEIAINLGELTEHQLAKIVRSGYTAAKAVGSGMAVRFTKSKFSYTTPDGFRWTVGIGRFGHQPRILGLPLR